jgi:hypothetical protein
MLIQLPDVGGLARKKEGSEPVLLAEACPDPKGRAGMGGI